MENTGYYPTVIRFRRISHISYSFLFPKKNIKISRYIRSKLSESQKRSGRTELSESLSTLITSI